MTKPAQKRKIDDETTEATQEKVATTESPDLNDQTASTSQENNTTDLCYDEIDHSDLLQCEKWGSPGDIVCGLSADGISLDCARFATMTDLVKHIADVHNEHIQLMQSSFDTPTEFDAWRTELESTGGFEWRRVAGTPRSCPHMLGKTKHEAYRCVMGGNRIGGMRSRTQQSTCSCYIHAVIQADSTVFIRYSLVHCGHSIPSYEQEYDESFVAHDMVTVEQESSPTFTSRTPMAPSVVVVDDAAQEQDGSLKRTYRAVNVTATSSPTKTIPTMSRAPPRISNFLSKFKNAEPVGEGEVLAPAEAPEDTSVAAFSPQWYQKARRQFEMEKTCDSPSSSGQNEIYQTADGHIMSYEGSEPINNVCRPFSHALVDDVERWTRDEKHVHEVIDAIITNYPSEVNGRSETSLRQLIKRVRRERGLKGMAYVPWDLRKQLQATGRVRAKERRQGVVTNLEDATFSTMPPYTSQRMRYGSQPPIDYGHNVARGRTAAEMIRRLDEREEFVHVDVDDEHIVEE